MPAMAPLLSSWAAAVAMADTVLGGGGAAYTAPSSETLKALLYTALQVNTTSLITACKEEISQGFKLEPCHHSNSLAICTGGQNMGQARV